MNAIAVPSRLEEWSYDIVSNLVSKPQDESYTYDFKAVLNAARRDEASKVNHEIRKTTAAFANTVGGFVIFGVADVKSGLTGHARIIGIEPKPDLSKEFTDKTHVIVPAIYFEVTEIEIPNSQNILWIVHIPLSPLRPHGFVEKDQWHFWKRGRGRNVPMSYEELREQFLGTEERRKKLQLFYLEARRILQNLRLTYVTGRMRTSSIGQMTIEANVLESLWPDVYLLIHEDMNLVNAIGETRMAIDAMRLKTSQFIALGGQGPSERDYEEHNQFMRSRAQFLEGRLRTIISVLEERHGLENFRNLYVA